MDDAHSYLQSHYASSHATSHSASMHMHPAAPELEAKLGKVHLGGQLDDNALLLSSSGMYFYGTVGDRIGEAAACFLAWWGVDLFMAEEDKLLPAFASSSPSHRTMTTTTAGDININTTTNAAYTRTHLTSNAHTARIWTCALARQLRCFFRAGRVEAVRVCQACHRATKESQWRGMRGGKGMAQAV